MLRFVLKFFLLFMLAVSPIFANENISIFNQQGYVTQSEPLDEGQFYAIKGPMPSKPSFYFGVKFGPGVAKLKPNVALTKNGAKYGSDIKEEKDALYGDIGGFFGYGTNFDQFYLAAEVSGAFNLIDRNVNLRGRVQDHFFVKQPFFAAFDVIPGYLTKSRNWLLYGRLGVGGRYTKFNFKKDSSVSNTEIDDGNKIRFRFTYRAGFGFEYFMSDTFGVRLEYIYSVITANNSQKIIEKYNSSPTSTDIYRSVYTLGRTGIHTVSLGFSIHT